MLVQTDIQNLIDEIVAGYQPEKIYLFGSYANGKQNNSSDIDLFIIKDTGKRKIERTREVRSCIKTYPATGLDIFVYTADELQKGFSDVINIGKEAVTIGKLLYERV